ncbi:SDR family NAD(P)-dependent oxidoreductase [Burkholderia sp. Ax-1719]|uniref:SDR family NAD(P)-dependent oxidoreductase n=1 Tax=Burkholderia sp. Ax-1719 TaxID=2608334 RepID=UPI00141F0907|nr:SDR family NAD(P)-dependent oxidoreductase [Burkholderia sp. Ax-1719]NIE63068.1 SDR family NAD(P)-dependent oxidoreductase [Burkholderia sp. Ax-1719]
MKTYLVIGAGPGIALSTAKKFAKEGYKIVLSSRSDSKLRSAIENLRSAGAEVNFETVDSANAAAVQQLIQKYSSELAVVHYNSGVLHYDGEGQVLTSPLSSQDVSALTSEMSVNLVNAMVAIKTAQEALTPHGGTILLTGGGLGIEPSADFINISIAKAGLRAAAKALFEPLRDVNIHMATVTVCTFVSPDTDKSQEIGDAFWALHAQESPATWDWEKIVN